MSSPPQLPEKPIEMSFSLLPLWMLNIIKVSPIGLGCSGQGLDLALPAEGAEAVRAIVAEAFARLDLQFQPLHGCAAAMDDDTVEVGQVVAVGLGQVGVGRIAAGHDAVATGHSCRTRGGGQGGLNETG
jgi:hypothetical protein